MFEESSAWDYENGFYLTSQPQRIGKLLAQYDIYKQIVNLPGNVVELGVFKGASLARLLTYRELLESPASRQVVGFDSFGVFPPQEEAADAAFIEEWEAEAGFGYSASVIESFLHAKHFRNFDLVAGDVIKTVPSFLRSNPHFRIALLHLDLDVYEPTRAMIDLIYPRIVHGGIVMIDDYAATPGASRAIDEFLLNRRHRLLKLPLSHVPAYFVKD